LFKGTSFQFDEIAVVPVKKSDVALLMDYVSNYSHSKLYFARF